MYPNSGTTASCSAGSTWRDVTVRYKQTFLGVAWAILVPLFTAAIYVHRFRPVREVPIGKHALPAAGALGVDPDAVLHLVAHWVEHEPRGEHVARHEGVLPASAAATGGSARALGRPAAGTRRSRPAHGVLRHVAGRCGGPDRPIVPGARLGHRARDRPRSVRPQRAVPGRPVHASASHCRASARIGRPVCDPGDSGEVAVDSRGQSDDGRRSAAGGGRSSTAAHRTGAR